MREVLHDTPAACWPFIELLFWRIHFSRLYCMRTYSSRQFTVRTGSKDLVVAASKPCGVVLVDHVFLIYITL